MPSGTREELSAPDFGLARLSTDAIDVDVDLSTEPTGESLNVRLTNTHGEAIGIRLEQPLGPDLSPSRITVDDEDTEPWQTSDDSLVLMEKLDPGQTVETGYVVIGADRSAMRELLWDVILEVRSLDGVDLGSFEGTDFATSVSDYVLKDVEEVEPSEFAWTSVETSDEDSEDRLQWRWRWLVYILLIALIVTVAVVLLVRPGIVTSLSEQVGYIS